MGVHTSGVWLRLSHERFSDTGSGGQRVGGRALGETSGRRRSRGIDGAGGGECWRMSSMSPREGCPTIPANEQQFVSAWEVEETSEEVLDRLNNPADLVR